MQTNEPDSREVPHFIRRQEGQAWMKFTISSFSVRKVFQNKHTVHTHYKYCIQRTCVQLHKQLRGVHTSLVITSRTNTLVQIELACCHRLGFVIACASPPREGARRSIPRTRRRWSLAGFRLDTYQHGRTQRREYRSISIRVRLVQVHCTTAQG